MSAINREQMKELRQQLQAMHRRLLSTVDGLGYEALRPSARLGGGQTAEAPGDTGDLSVQDDARDVAILLLGNERQLLGQVTAALERIDRGEYGRCTECGRPISTERLRALPYTQYCIDDANRLEKENGGPPAQAGLL